MYPCDELFMRSLVCYLGVYFPCPCPTRAINTTITLSWAHKQFATRVHALFDIYIYICVISTFHHCYTLVNNVQNTIHCKYSFSITFEKRYTLHSSPISCAQFKPLCFLIQIILHLPCGTILDRVWDVFIKSHRNVAASIRTSALIAMFMGPTWGPSGADRTQVGPLLAPWTLLSRYLLRHHRVGIGIPIIKLKWSSDLQFRMFKMPFPCQ